MKVILKTLVKNLITMPFFFVFSIFDIKLGKEIGNVLYTVSGIIFSICISQIMSFDLSTIKNIEVYNRFSKSLKSIRDSFLVEFALSSLSFLFLAIFDDKKIDWSIEVCKFHFSVNTGLQLIVIYSVLFFLWNYIKLYDNKSRITTKLQDESLVN